MCRSRTSGWWFLALPALVCIPCLFLPLFIAGGAAAASVAGGRLGGAVVAGIILLVGFAVSAGVYLILRARGRRAAACCPPDLAWPATSYKETAEDPEQPVKEATR